MDGFWWCSEEPCNLARFPVMMMVVVMMMMMMMVVVLVVMMMMVQVVVLVMMEANSPSAANRSIPWAKVGRSKPFGRCM